MEIPASRYVVLYGSMSGDWREPIAHALDAADIAWYDPTDAGWTGIDGSNGDQHQSVIDALVAKERLALEGAACAVFHVARRKVVAGRETGEVSSSLSTRFELGFAAGRKIRSFVHIEADVEGRNYLWAQVALGSDWMTRSDTIQDAVARAIEFMRGGSRPA